jgi:sialic acid synthase SpsE
MSKSTSLPIIIAEVGNLHEGSIGLAKAFIKEVAACGADVVKFQTHLFDAESLPDAPNPPYFREESRRQYFQRTSFNVSQWKDLKEYAESECRLRFLSSVFSMEAIDMLENVGLGMYKVPSGEVNNLPLLERIVKTGKPVFLSSGMSSWSELDRAVTVLKRTDNLDLVLLQCSSIYPCPPEKTGLNIIKQMKERYRTRIGFSDHTPGFSAAIAAVVLGAEVIEKHFTLSRKMYGSDAPFSLEPHDFRRFVSELRDTVTAICSETDKNILYKELKEMKVIFEKSIVARRELHKGTLITVECLAFKKPGDGIPAARYQELVGRRTKVNIPVNTKLTESMLE